MYLNEKILNLCLTKMSLQTQKVILKAVWELPMDILSNRRQKKKRKCLSMMISLDCQRKIISWTILIKSKKGWMNNKDNNKTIGVCYHQKVKLFLYRGPIMGPMLSLQLYSPLPL